MSEPLASFLAVLPSCSTELDVGGAATPLDDSVRPFLEMAFNPSTSLALTDPPSAPPFCSAGSIARLVLGELVEGDGLDEGEEEEAVEEEEEEELGSEGAGDLETRGGTGVGDRGLLRRE